jgi:bacterioferritin
MQERAYRTASFNRYQSLQTGAPVLTTNSSICFKLDTLSHQKSMMSRVVNLNSATQNWELNNESSSCSDWREDAIRTLKDALIVELVCAVRYKHLSENSSVWPEIGAEFQIHANEKLAHANKLARRIAQLGEGLEYSPNVLMHLDLATHKRNRALQSIIEASLASENKAISKFTKIIAQIDEVDSSTRSLLEEILNDEREHADEMKGWLAN